MIQYSQQLQDPTLAIRPNLLKWMPAKPAFAYEPSIQSMAKLRAWQKKGRRQMDLCLGDPIPSVAPSIKVLAKEQLEGYKRTTFTIATAPSIRALCWLLMPDGASPSSPLPAMIATPGHGMGAKDLMAMDKTGQLREQGMGYQKDYALQAMQWGACVLVIEPLGFGERRDAAMLSTKSTESGCQAAYSLATMAGTTLARIRMNDLICGLDYLQTLPQVDPDRIGLMGISGGGQMTLWTAALETRFKLAVVSGYLNTFADSVMAMQHCICNFVPGLARDFDMTDIAMLAAPRPLLIESAISDKIFPIKASKSAGAKLRRYYKALGYPDRVVQDVFEGEHQWSGKKLNAFLDKHL